MFLFIIRKGKQENILDRFPPENLIFEYLRKYYKKPPYVKAMIDVIERMIENYDNVSNSEVDEHS